MGGVFICIIKSMKSEARQHPSHQLTFCTYFHESSKKNQKKIWRLHKNLLPLHSQSQKENCLTAP